MKGMIRGSVYLLSVAVMLAPVFGSICFAQESAADPEASTTLRVYSRLVVLDVVVTDKAGLPRTDLKREDFVVTENGVPQTITSFEPPTAHILPPGSPITSTADLQARAPDAPVSIIVLDEINTTYEDMAFARWALKKYLNDKKELLSAPTILLAASYNHFKLLHDYTQDRAAILDALNHHLNEYPWHLRTGDTTLEQVAISLSALERIAQAANGHPGRKNIIWVGRGFPGIDLSSPSLDPATINAITSAVQQAINILRDARVTLYTLDPSLTSSAVAVTDPDDPVADMDTPDVVADPFGEGVQFTGLTIATGGRTFAGRNDVDKELAQSARDAVSYYTIAYRPTGDSDAAQAYRNIHVGVTIPKLVVDYRTGYYTGSQSEAPVVPKMIAASMDAAGESTLIYTGLDVVAQAKRLTPDAYLVGVPEHELTWISSVQGDTAKLKLLVVELDDKDKVLRRSSFIVAAERKNDQLPSASNPGGLAQLAIPLKPVAGATRLRFVVRSEVDGRIGTADIQLKAKAH